jgi:hypothetical protein
MQSKVRGTRCYLSERRVKNERSSIISFRVKEIPLVVYGWGGQHRPVIQEDHGSKLTRTKE